MALLLFLVLWSKSYCQRADSFRKKIPVEQIGTSADQPTALETTPTVEINYTKSLGAVFGWEFCALALAGKPTGTSSPSKYLCSSSNQHGSGATLISLRCCHTTHPNMSRVYCDPTHWSNVTALFSEGLVLKLWSVLNEKFRINRSGWSNSDEFRIGWELVMWLICDCSMDLWQKNMKGCRR